MNEQYKKLDLAGMRKDFTKSYESTMDCIDTFECIDKERINALKECINSQVHCSFMFLDFLEDIIKADTN